VSIDLPRPRTLLLIVALFVWFACGVEGWRRGQYWHRLAQHPSLLHTEPWNSFRAFVFGGAGEEPGLVLLAGYAIRVALAATYRAVAPAALQPSAR
jgi:hypothetical protein